MHSHMLYTHVTVHVTIQGLPYIIQYVYLNPLHASPLSILACSTVV